MNPWLLHWLLMKFILIVPYQIRRKSISWISVGNLGDYHFFSRFINLITWKTWTRSEWKMDEKRLAASVLRNVPLMSSLKCQRVECNGRNWQHLIFQVAWKQLAFDVGRLCLTRDDLYDGKSLSSSLLTFQTDSECNRCLSEEPPIRVDPAFLIP